MGLIKIKNSLTLDNSQLINPNHVKNKVNR